MFSNIIARYEAFIARQKAEPCTGDILCPRSGKRHRDGCIGRTVPFSVYVKGLRSL